MNEFSLFAIFFIGAVALSVIGAIIRGKAALNILKGVKNGMSEKEIKNTLKEEAKHPAWQAYQRMGMLLILGFMMYWFWMWMKGVGQAIPMPWNDYVWYAVLGLQLTVASLIVLRTLVMLFSVVTDSTVVDTIADPKSNWSMLEGRLLLLAFFVTCVAAFIPIYFVMKQA